jgi:hypothetical protein
MDPVERADMMRRARKIGGLPGAVIAGALLGWREILEKPKDKQAVVVEASSEPVDMDADGITVPLEGVGHAVMPPLPPLPSAYAPHTVRRRSRRRAHRR